MTDKPIAQLIAEMNEQHEKSQNVLREYEEWLETRPDLKKQIEFMRMMRGGHSSGRVQE